MKTTGLSALENDILNLLISEPDGLDIEEIREKLGLDGQQHLDRRVRAIRDYYHVPGEHRGRRYVYVYKGEREDPVGDDGGISSRLRAEILNRAKGRCGMCGQTVADDGIKLQVDHKIPRRWGGLTEAENLWAICSLCNSGKRDYFSSFDDETMSKIMKGETVYERILEAMRLFGKTPSWLLEFVANADDFQEDWQKRARELRYPPIGVEFTVNKEKLPSGKVTSFYTLTKDADLPADHKQLIKEHERQVRRKD